MVCDWASRFLKDPAKIDDAIELSQLNADNFPDLSPVFGQLGDAYAQKGDTRQAAANYQKALTLNPGDAEMEKKVKNVR